MAVMLAAPVALSRLTELEAALNSAIRGKPEVVRLSLACLLARGHLLIEDVPGVGKTTLAQALARSVDASFHRLQFTSDMLPSDVLGVTIYNAHTEEFEFKPGPVFTNFLLADEINRATPKTQSALLEAMNELQVTIDGRSLSAGAAVHGDRDAESGGASRHVSAARIAARPVPDADPHRLSGTAEPSAKSCGAAERRHAETMRSVLSGEELICACRKPVRAGERGRCAGGLHARRSWSGRATHESLAMGVSPRGAQALYRATQALAAGGRTRLRDSGRRQAPGGAGVRASRGRELARRRWRSASAEAARADPGQRS